MNQERLKQILHYAPETGEFTWLVKTGRSAVGKRAGQLKQASRGTQAYWFINFEGVRYAASRLAWLYMTGDWPTIEVDHTNGIGADNRWDNLRSADGSENKANRGPQVNNTTGLKGVIRKRRGFAAQIAWRHKSHYLGTFDTPEEAHRAYCSAAQKLFGEFARTA